MFALGGGFPSSFDDSHRKRSVRASFKDVIGPFGEKQVFSVAILATVLHAIAGSKLRHTLLSNFFIAVRLFRRT